MADGLMLCEDIESLQAACNTAWNRLLTHKRREAERIRHNLETDAERFAAGKPIND